MPRRTFSFSCPLQLNASEILELRLDVSRLLTALIKVTIIPRIGRRRSPGSPTIFTQVARPYSKAALQRDRVRAEVGADICQLSEIVEDFAGLSAVETAQTMYFRDEGPGEVREVLYL